MKQNEKDEEERKMNVKKKKHFTIEYALRYKQHFPVSCFEKKQKKKQFVLQVKNSGLLSLTRQQTSFIL